MVLGSPQREGNAEANQPPNNLSLSQVLSATRIKDGREKNIKIPPRMSPDTIYLSLYKSKVTTNVPQPMLVWPDHLTVLL